jgi:phytoene dehydrogenase-like protein
MAIQYDAVVVGAGPNGLAAAVRLAQSGLGVLLVEANDTIGGGARSAELTRPGVVHDTCSGIHPMAAGSPFFRSLPLERHGLEWIHPDVPLAHPFDGGRAAVLARSLTATTDGLGSDGASYRRLFEPLVAGFDDLAQNVMRPLLRMPRRPMFMARFGVHALQPAAMLARRKFDSEEARGLFTGLAAHSLLPMDAISSSAIGLVLGAAGHAVGWPMPRGGAQRISDALGSLFRELGGKIETGRRIQSLQELPPARSVLLDVTGPQLLHLTGERLPEAYRRWLQRTRNGPGVYKIDYLLSEPVPWTAPDCGRAGTVHLGGSMEEIAASERTVASGGHPERPFVLLAEHSRFDSTRAPKGLHTLWAYCHVPHGSTVEMDGRIEDQIERFAPGFRACILERHTLNCADLERRNANLAGGDINGGSAALSHLVSRPVPTPVPYRTPLDGVYVCSSSTPPSGGVHGMCGYHAAEAVLKDQFS